MQAKAEADRVRVIGEGEAAKMIALAAADAERITKTGLATAETIARQAEASGGRAISLPARSSNGWPRRWRSRAWISCPASRSAPAAKPGRRPARADRHDAGRKGQGCWQQTHRANRPRRTDQKLAAPLPRNGTGRSILFSRRSRAARSCPGYR
jgi:hypothetical protein